MNLKSVKLRHNIIGHSELLDRALSTAVRVAPTDLTVLIKGESGVGKEVFSRIIHQQSARKHESFIAINCGAIPAGTINSELFGHEKGAFTGATSDRRGYFEVANKGTIFLDEIGEMPLDTQAYLLRVLENGEYIKVGSSTVQKTDVRIIAATNVDLLEKIKKGKFREDLYYRLSTVPIEVPALKERKEDITVLFRKFASDFAEKYNTSPVRLDERAELVIQNYAWPGNIRELKNLVEQLSVLSEEKQIDAQILLDNFPYLLKRNLPAKTEQGEASGSMEEREILYKLLFDMKSDLNDLKGLVFGLIQKNDLDIPSFQNGSQITSITELLPQNDRDYSASSPATDYSSDESLLYGGQEESFTIDHSAEPLSNAEIVEEILSLEDMEKEMIGKALSKYKGRRKEAASELGISERTLYRKIKQYNI